jgi:hypothetical protein
MFLYSVISYNLQFTNIQNLKVSSLKESEADLIKERTEASRVTSVPKSIISCWVHVAKTMKAVFSSKFTMEGYQMLQKHLQDELTLLPKV